MRIQPMFEPCPPAELRELGLEAERLGFDAAWLPNILQARDPFLAFAPLALASQKIRMGPVAVSPFELHPAKMANALLTLHELSGGRAALVVGGGGGALIAMNVKPDRQSRYPRMVRGVRECVEFLRAAASGAPVDFHGELYAVDGYVAPWTVQPPPPLYVAANGPQMLALAASHGDGVMLSDICPAHIDGTMSTIRDGLAKAGRQARGFAVSNVLAWHIREDREAAYSEARRKLWVRGIWERSRIEPYLDPADCDLVAAALPRLAQAYARGEDPSPHAVPRRLMDALADGLTLVGDLAAVDGAIARLHRLKEAGVTELALRLYGEPEAALRRVAERVAPAIAG